MSCFFYLFIVEYQNIINLIYKLAIITMFMYFGTLIAHDMNIVITKRNEFAIRHNDIFILLCFPVQYYEYYLYLICVLKW